MATLKKPTVGQAPYVPHHPLIMATSNSNDLRVQNSKCLVSKVQEGNTYLFISKPTAWETGEETPPTPNNTSEEFYRTSDQMLSAKRVENTEVYHLVRRVDWAAGVAYDMYSDKVTQTTRSTSGASNIYDALYVVVKQQRGLRLSL